MSLTSPPYDIYSDIEKKKNIFRFKEKKVQRRIKYRFVTMALIYPTNMQQKSGRALISRHSIYQFGPEAQKYDRISRHVSARVREFEIGVDLRHSVPPSNVSCFYRA